MLRWIEGVPATRPWLTGDGFSLADIALIPYVNRLAMLGAERVTQSAGGASGEC